MDKKALIAGATGLIGRELVRLILEKNYYQEITILTRRELDIKDNRLKVVIIDDFDFLEDFDQYFDAQDVYCLLGTTMKKAGSKEAFRKIDLDYPLKMAELAAKKPSFEKFLLVTSLGANSASPLFYNKVKGELEDRVADLDLKSLKIFRPSLLIGFREEVRVIEEIGKIVSSFFSFFMIGSRRRLWTIEGRDVAKAMIIVATTYDEGKEVFSSNDILNIVHNR